MPEVPLAIAFDATSGVLTVSGDLDELLTTALRTSIHAHSQGYTSGLTLDLSGVTYLSSAAVGVLAKAREEFSKANADLELAAASGSVAQRVLTVCAIPHRSH